MNSKIRNQWILLLTPITLLFFAAVFAVLQAKPREIKLGKYPTQEAAVVAAMQELDKGVGQWTRAASVTVHFTGPHPIPEEVGNEVVPEKTEEVVSYNRRLKVLLTYMNRRDGKGWKFEKVVCPNTDDARLSKLAKEPELLLDSPEKCGCKLEDVMQIG